ncbi:protein-L-isoaspartate O-methyltransferase [Falsochrobactrum shanghaiense]|uniref:Protein-L-isoaspartate O-methyltransferase n=1 Tax=Falsochrobactrum shanghaiense TaxID=2201899 RepID=A0A316JBQ2_9HYPH|nr:protein-L-isoaspartate(D-aspartate) O-methyltransferase [Falsochrobactrum shanghaiense]PWL18671.1 protein-L-isoaspartate O-methyltransferase [Falsochrobactrum shanghaiense]
MPDFEYARAQMVETQLIQRGIHDKRVLDAMGKVPRERFVDAGWEESAYEDSPLPIAQGQTISQPYIVALMLEAAELMPAARILEVGTGSGYAAAVMAQMVQRLFSIERHASLGNAARLRLKELGCENVELRIGDGSKGWPEQAPFDAIIVAAGSTDIPPEFYKQLAIGGNLIIPVGPNRRLQRLLRIRRRAANEFEEQDLGSVMFVPLVASKE